MNITYPPHKNVTIPLRRRGGPSGHGRVGVVPADPAPRQFECPPKADVSRTTVVTAFSAITSRYTLLSSRTRSDARTLHHPPSTIHRAPHTTQSPNRSPLNYSRLNHSITQQPSSDFRARTLALHLAQLNPSNYHNPGLRKRRRLKILNKYPFKNSSVRVAAVI